MHQDTKSARLIAVCKRTLNGVRCNVFATNKFDIHTWIVIYDHFTCVRLPWYTLNCTAVFLWEYLTYTILVNTRNKFQLRKSMYYYFSIVNGTEVTRTNYDLSSRCTLVTYRYTVSVLPIDSDLRIHFKVATLEYMPIEPLLRWSYTGRFLTTIFNTILLHKKSIRV